MKPAALLCLATMIAMSSGTAWTADAVANASTDRKVLAERSFADVRFVIGEGKAGKWLEMYVDGDFIAVFRDFAVDEVVAAPDGRHFLALSNASKSAYAFAILDRKGRIEASLPHGGNLHYCNRTSWGIGEWVDVAQPRATFSMQKNELTSPATEFLFATVRGCDGKTVVLARPPPPSLKADPANADGTDRNSFFIGNAIANLRGLDPTFGGRTLTLIDGRRQITPSTTFQSTALRLPGNWTDVPISERRTCYNGNCNISVELVLNRADGSMQVFASGLVGDFIALPGSHRVFACAMSTGIVEATSPVPAVVDLNGGTTALPSHPGLLRLCVRAGTGDEVLLAYTMANAGKAYTLARVFDGSGALLAEGTFEKAGTLRFNVAGKEYSEAVPGP